MLSRFRTLLLVSSALSAPSAVNGSDWIHWRGPAQNGHVTGVSLPDQFDTETPGKNGLVWKAPVGGRSAPLLMGNKLFVFGARDADTPVEGERITCFDADTGKVLWEHDLNVYHSDIEFSRLGWTTLTADPATNRLYSHTTAGELVCLNAADGKKVWSRQLTEEFGRFTGYGGRIPSPIFDSGLVICPLINSAWGDMARGWNRFLAFDGATGEVVWISETAFPNKDTYQSHPVVAVIGGQRLLIAGGGDGALHAFKVRTGERAWSHLFCAKAVNPAPVVDGNLVYAAHGDENPEPGGSIGRVICLDASQVDAKTKKPKLVWEYKRNNRFGLSHPALADGRLYMPDDASELFCFNAKTGKLLWKYKYGTVSRGAPLVVDDKLYIFDVNAKLTVLTLRGDEEPDEAKAEEYTFRVPKGVTGFNETHGTPIAANGRLYFTTSYDTYCVGGAKPEADKPAATKANEEKPFDPAAAPAALRLHPFEVSAKPGETVPVTLKYLDANGRELPAPKGAVPQWTLPAPPVPKGKTTAPPALKGELKGAGDTATVVLDKLPSQQGLIGVTAGKLAAQARVRVVPQLPYKQDFEKTPEGAVPAGWVNTAGKFFVKKLPDGSSVLSKLNTDGRPPLARANGYFTLPAAANYTIECDLQATEANGKLPDMGIVNGRYTLVLDGKTDPEKKGRTVRLATWDPRGRYPVAVPFDWQKDTWYRAKFEVVPGEKTAVARGKVWKRGEPEPADWTIRHEYPGPNRQGAAAVFGYVSNVTPGIPGSEIYYDNVVVTPNK